MLTYELDSSGRATIDKDPAAVLDYSFNWTDYLAGLTDVISSFTVIAAGVTINSFSFSGATTTAWVSGGVVGEKVQVTFRIVTVGGRTDDRSIYLKIKER